MNHQELCIVIIVPAAQPLEFLHSLLVKVFADFLNPGKKVSMCSELPQDSNIYAHLSRWSGSQTPAEFVQFVCQR